jgi:putative molybdopterin biosynthesis protein
LGNILLTAQEVADILKITKNTVYELVKRGELASCKVGKQIRINAAAVEAYLTQSKNRHPATSAAPYAPEQEVAKSENKFSHPDCCSGMIICGQDIALDIIAQRLNQQFTGLNACRSYMGSYNGLYALYQGRVHVATAHLWDRETNEYNVPYVKKFLPGIPAVIIRIAQRYQGFYVKAGNHKSIEGWEDLLRQDITIVAREKGSGTRILLDQKLQQLGIMGSSIAGYDKEFTSHLAVASAISCGEADIGLGSEKGSQQVKDIQFIPLQKESYDLVMKVEDVDKPQYKAILDIVTSADFKKDLLSIGCYDISQTGRWIQKI